MALIDVPTGYIPVGAVFISKWLGFVLVDRFIVRSPRWSGRVRKGV